MLIKFSIFMQERPSQHIMNYFLSSVTYLSYTVALFLLYNFIYSLQKCVIPNRKEDH